MWPSSLVDKVRKSQFQQREAADRQKKLAEMAPERSTPAADLHPVRSAPVADSQPAWSAPAADPHPVPAPRRTAAEPGHRAAAPPARQPAAERVKVANGGAASSAGGRAAPGSSGSVGSGTGGGKVRAMFQTRRAGAGPAAATAQTSPVGWDRSYPLDPIKKAPAPARKTAPPPAAQAKPAAAGRPKRPEAAPEPRRPARAAPAPARPPPAAAKENRAPASAPAERPPPTDPNMAQCSICSRSFAKDRLDKHTAICEKSSKKKRKVFDPVKMRVKGTESEGYLRKIKSKKPEPVAPPKKDWRKQHEDFIRNIRAAKKAQAHLAAGGKIQDLPPPPPMDTSDYVACPHCGRKFSEAAADRHIPKCANISSNKKPAAGARAQKPAASGRTQKPAARLRR